MHERRRLAVAPGGTRRPSPSPTRPPRGMPTLGNRALAHALAGGAPAAIQRELVTHAADAVETPAQAYMKYYAAAVKGKLLVKNLPKGLAGDPRGKVERPERVEAKITKDSIRAKERKATAFTGKVTGMAKAEQFLTQGTSYSGIYHGGHLIADQMTEGEDSFTFWNVAPQWGTFNTPEYRKMETFIVEYVSRKVAKPKRGAAPPPPELMVTAKVGYEPDEITVPAERLRDFGLPVPATAPALTFHSRTPRTWTLRARATTPLPKATKPAPKFTKEAWARQLAQASDPTPRTGFATRTGYTTTASDRPEIEHRAAGSRAPAAKKAKRFPAARYGDRETWKMRTIQWVPKVSAPSKAEVADVIRVWFPSHATASEKEIADLKAQLAEAEARAALAEWQLKATRELSETARGALAHSMALYGALTAVDPAYLSLAEEYHDAIRLKEQIVTDAIAETPPDLARVATLLLEYAAFIKDAPERYVATAKALEQERLEQEQLDEAQPAQPQATSQDEEEEEDEPMVVPPIALQPIPTFDAVAPTPPAVTAPSQKRKFEAPAPKPAHATDDEDDDQPAEPQRKKPRADPVPTTPDVATQTAPGDVTMTATQPAPRRSARLRTRPTKRK